ncbi:hypothetical protein P4679_24395 [Priestia megaterium]|uniref:hypothetical protein n=1 Tax=Priestia megaterium TaxID=1404 RepID=UPI002E1F7D06|nr:hypothetical protein [Priestia megaterium]
MNSRYEIEKAKGKKRRKVAYVYMFLCIIDSILITLSVHNSVLGHLKPGILLTISVWVSVIWIIALIYLKDFISGASWSKVPMIGRGFWWIAFLLPVVHCANAVCSRFF